MFCSVYSSGREPNNFLFEPAYLAGVVDANIPIAECPRFTRSQKFLLVTCTKLRYCDWSKGLSYQYLVEFMVRDKGWFQGAPRLFRTGTALRSCAGPKVCDSLVPHTNMKMRLSRVASRVLPIDRPNEGALNRLSSMPAGCDDRRLSLRRNIG